MGESIVEGTITKWLKKPGDKVQRDEPLFEISTDKVDAEIPAPASGVLQEIKVTEGTTVGVNTVVGTIAVDGEAAAKPAAAADSARPVAPPSRRQSRRLPREAEAAPPRPAPPADLRRRCHEEETKKPAPRRSSAKSPASTASVSPKFPAPDSAAASPSRTSCRSSRARDLSQPARADASVRPADAATAAAARAPRARPLPHPTPATSSP